MTDTVIAEATAEIAAPTRPQPLGAFGLPVGYLLIPAGDDTEPARRALLAGCLPEQWPPRLTAHRYALQGDRRRALAALPGDDPVSRYNRFVLNPDLEDAEDLRAALGDFGALVDVVLFAIGRREAPPEVGTAAGELAAVILAARASQQMTVDAPAAIASLDAAVAAGLPAPLAGVLLGSSASICLQAGDVGDALDRCERALRLLDGAHGLRVERAELHVTAAGLLHDRAAGEPGLIAKAVPHYHAALALVRREDAPLLWAAAHADLATAYLTMPMVEASGQLRLGVAAQSLRSALTVYTPQEHPQRWASVQLNLANSLVYTPSKHQADNLVEAVELYEAVLQARDRDTDPLGRARVLANQGNVLAHLGAFTDARAKLYEARSLFEELCDEESVRAVRGVLDEVARQIALNRTAEPSK
jgi:tetratricopeptide (TPR) repeat protein